METMLFAQIFTPTILDGGKRAIGTAYPIAKGLILTDRHVLYPDSIDESKPREVVWPDCQFTSEVTDIVFDGDKDLDIAVVACQTPPQVNSPIILTDRDPVANEGWDSFGYPKAGKDGAKGIREKIPGKGTFFQPDANSHSLHLTSEGDATTKKLWQGMSGAPVFSRNPRQLLAMITSTPEYLEERLYAVSITYLLKTDADFKKAVGYQADAQIATSLLPEVKLGEDFKNSLSRSTHGSPGARTCDVL